MKFAIHTATNYKGTQHALRGCVNDWKNFLQLDKELGIDQGKTISLIGENYKKALATEAVCRFSDLMQAGDILVGSNSSHGTQVYDQHGDQQDGIDQALVDNDCNLILDDDIFAGLKKFKPGTLVVAWLDNCFAGTMDRSFKPKNAHLMDPAIQCNAVMYFGCKQEQTSADAFINGEFQGALTYCSLKALRDANMDLTYAQLLERTNVLLGKGGYQQVAQMACTSWQLLDKKVFTM